MGVEIKGFDVFSILVNYWNYQLSNPKQLYDILKTLEPTKEQYDEIKDILLHWDKVQEVI